jgi:exopolysaccharide production protein ExoY
VTPAAEQTFTLKRAGKAQPHPLGPVYRVEPLIAGLALLALAPVMLVVCVAIVLLSRRSPLVRHMRVGWRGEELPTLKLRTMWEPNQQWGRVFEIEDVSNPVPENKCGDGRVTSQFAAWCRRYSIDEIPQLYHVFRGQMSLVGPRPITRMELEEHYGRSAEEVLSLRPGLTGLWQVRGRSRLTYAQRRRLDVWLAGHSSPGLYLRILLRSVPVILKGDDAY